MLGLSVAQLAVGAGALLGGTVVAGAVLTSSGPLSADRPDDPYLPSSPEASIGFAAAETPTSQPSAAPPETGNYPPGHLLQPGEIVDFSRLPVVDSSSWKLVSGKYDSISVRVPPNWEVILQEVHYNQGGSGDSIAVFEPTEKDADAGAVIPGWVKVDLAVHPFKVPFGMRDGPIKSTPLATSPNGVEIVAHQFGQSTQFPENKGSITLFVTGEQSGRFLTGAGYLALPATVEDVAVAQEVLNSVVVR